MISYAAAAGIAAVAFACGFIAKIIFDGFKKKS